MYIYSLYLKNVGPFLNTDIEFIKEGKKRNNITIITGENGAGKSIILDSIRGLLAGIHSNRVLERSIISDANNFALSMYLDCGKGVQNIVSTITDVNDGHFKIEGVNGLGSHIYHQLDTITFKEKWIVDYWTSQINTGKFSLDSITKLNTKSYLKDGILGTQTNVDVIKLITFFEYLSGSGNEAESDLGKSLFTLIKALINECLNYGEFSHISRITLQPILKIRGQELTLEKLSSGNIYLIQRLLSLVYKAYSAFDVYGGEPSEINKVKGLLLIDEIENHLHPKWQKKILKIIRKYFPNLQIILTTHSPFIISSIDSINVLVCQMVDKNAIVTDETDFYKNKPIEEIIRTSLFGTDSFSEDISELLAQRKRAIDKDDMSLAKEIETKLIEKNPEYFRYFNLDQL